MKKPNIRRVSRWEFVDVLTKIGTLFLDPITSGIMKVDSGLQSESAAVSRIHSGSRCEFKDQKCGIRIGADHLLYPSGSDLKACTPTPGYSNLTKGSREYARLFGLLWLERLQCFT